MKRSPQIEKGAEAVLVHSGPRVTWAEGLEATVASDGEIHVRYAEKKPPGPGGPFDFAEAVRRVAARGTMYVCRQHERDGRAYEMRELRATLDGHLFVRVAGTEEQRHLTVADVQATDWRETL